MSRVATLFAQPTTPTRVVCHVERNPLTWGDFAARVAALAASLHHSPATKYTLACEQPQHFLIALLALWQAGRTALIPANFQQATVAQLGAPLLDDATVQNALPSTDALSPLDPHHCHLALFTSGSSGEPKRIVKTLAQLDAEIDRLEQLFGTQLGEACILATVPHHHIYGLLFRLLWPLAAGRAFDCATLANPEELTEHIAHHQAHALISSPAHLARFPALMNLADWQPRPRAIFSSGGPLAADTAHSFATQLGQAPIEVFGSTETGGVAWRQRDGSAEREWWTPLPDVTVSQDADGALILNSPFITDGNWRMDDAIELRPNGRFLLGNRLDRILKVEGKRLSLPEMEDQLARHPWVARAALTPLPGAGRLGAVLVLSEPGALALAQDGKHALGQTLRSHLGARFDRVLLPRRFRFVPAIPLSDRGKISVSVLQALFDAHDPADA